MSFIGKIRTRFKTAATIVEEGDTLPVEKNHYPHDATIATAQPYYGFVSIDEVPSFLGFEKTGETKNHSHKAMELRSHYGHLNNVKTFVISGHNLEMSAIIKWAKGEQGPHLDALIVQDGYTRTCIACGPEGASRECLDMFLGCFRTAAQTLENDPTGKKTDAQTVLIANLRKAYPVLAVERLLNGLIQIPFSSNP